MLEAPPSGLWQHPIVRWLTWPDNPPGTAESLLVQGWPCPDGDAGGPALNTQYARLLMHHYL